VERRDQGLELRRVAVLGGVDVVQPTRHVTCSKPSRSLSSRSVYFLIVLYIFKTSYSMNCLIS
jgi:hypothetical protein